jgi:toxin-antitoxin system PIN domain toxin
LSLATDLLDINVWIALSLTNHRHHARAQAYWFEESNEELAFCRVTALGFLRLMTQPLVTGDPPLSVAQAWQAYQSFRDLPEVGLVPEPPTCDSLLEAWATSAKAPRRLWTDAYLAAFAKAGGFRLVTFDADFRRFPGLDLLLLKNDSPHSPPR